MDALKTLILTQADVRRLLPMTTCIDLMEEALASLGRGEGANPLRWPMKLPGGPGLLGMMPAASPETFGLKAMSVFPQNHGTAFDSHQGVVLLFDPERGFPVAIVEASEITAIRTAAVSGLATRLLAGEDAGDLAILGSGTQARTHLEAMAAVRELRRVRVYSPSRANREAFAERESESERWGFEVRAVASAREAVLGADLVCTTTSSREPVLEGAWLASGCHINAAGACMAEARELDSEAVLRSRLYTDRRESLLNESGDFLIPREEGAITNDHLVGELGQVLLGEAPGRASDDEITLFESLGLGVEDLAAAWHCHQRAKEEGVGRWVRLFDG